jgi:hypothetical protein
VGTRLRRSTGEFLQPAGSAGPVDPAISAKLSLDEEPRALSISRRQLVAQVGRQFAHFKQGPLIARKAA